MRERSVYSINQRRRLEAETTHEREKRLQQLSDNQQRKLDTETTSLRSRSPHNAMLLVIKCGGGKNGGRRPGRIYHVIRGTGVTRSSTKLV